MRELILGSPQELISNHLELKRYQELTWGSTLRDPKKQFRTYLASKTRSGTCLGPYRNLFRLIWNLKEALNSEMGVFFVAGWGELEWIGLEHLGSLKPEQVGSQITYKIRTQDKTRCRCGCEVRSAGARCRCKVQRASASARYAVQSTCECKVRASFAATAQYTPDAQARWRIIAYGP